MRMAFAEETGHLFYSIVRETLPRSEHEWVLDLRFAPVLEQAFLRYHEIRSRHWQLLASLFFGALVGLRLLGAWILSLPITPTELLSIQVLIAGVALPCIANLLSIIFQLSPPVFFQRMLLFLSVVLSLVLSQHFLWRNHMAGLLAASVGICQSAALITLIMRMRIRNALPVLFGLNAAVFGSAWMIEPVFADKLLLPIIMATAFGILISFLLEYDARRDFLSQAHVHQIAATDPLSRTLNRYAFYDQSRAEFDHARYSGIPLSVLLIDIDHFKQINDRYGHLIGDQAITWFGTICCSHIRAGDLIGRVGGEEFAILMPGANREEATQSAERLRTLLAKKQSLTLQPTPPFTISIGVTDVHPHDRSIQDMIARADICLYQAKRAGRDRIVTAPPGSADLITEVRTIEYLTADFV
jgi:diguanylate cyclase (GGDEF)-like protein